jgi:hypothetical protein
VQMCSLAALCSHSGAFPIQGPVMTFRGRRRGIRERIWEGRNPVAHDLKPPVLYRAAELFQDGHAVRQVADLLRVSL